MPAEKGFIFLIFITEFSFLAFKKIVISLPCAALQDKFHERRLLNGSGSLLSLENRYTTAYTMLNYILGRKIQENILLNFYM